MDALHIGVDVSRDRLDVAADPPVVAPFHVARSHEGLADLVERLGPLGACRIAVEATGGFETIVAAALAGAGLPVVVVNPAQVRAFAQALGKRAKTDPIDAAVIARFAGATKPPVRALPALELAPGAAVPLRHGGRHHLMLMELKQPLRDGDRFPVTLVFERGGSTEVMVDVHPVRAARTSAGGAAHH